MAIKSIPVFDFNKKLSKGTSFEFTKLEESYNPYDANHPHRHNYYEVLFFNGAGGSHEIDFNSYPIEKNSIHFISPGQVHLLMRKPNVTGFVISFADDFFLDKRSGLNFMETLPYFGGSEKFPIVRLSGTNQKKEAEELFNQISREFHSDLEDRIQALSSWVSLFLIFCRRLYLTQPISAKAGTFKNDLARKFIRLVDNQFIGLKSVSDYADLLNISPGHLNDSIKKETGKSASEIIHDRIVLESKRLLYHSEMSVKEIAIHLNYEDPSYFSKFFKKQTKATPDQFRNDIREKYH